MRPVLDLRAAVAREQAKQPMFIDGLDVLPKAELAAAQEHWRIHMVAEFASSRVFSGLVPQMMAAGLDFEAVRNVTEMARQEVDHGLLSARVYTALGGDPRSELFDLDPMPQHAGVPAIEAVLRNVISVSCSGETLAVAVIGGERERAENPDLKAILTQILRDEVGHSRFGWTLLKQISPSLDGEAKRRISAYLVAIFERDLRAMQGTLNMPEVSDAALSIGAPDGPSQWACFWETMTTVTVPGLQTQGFQAEWAWQRALLRVKAQPEKKLS